MLNTFTQHYWHPSSTFRRCVVCSPVTMTLTGPMHPFSCNERYVHKIACTFQELWLWPIFSLQITYTLSAVTSYRHHRRQCTHILPSNNDTPTFIVPWWIQRPQITLWINNTSDHEVTTWRLHRLVVFSRCDQLYSCVTLVTHLYEDMS